VYAKLTQHQVDGRCGYPVCSHQIPRFACHDTGNSDQKAIMRMCIQILITGTGAHLLSPPS
jgi:hypothetical protein